VAHFDRMLPAGRTEDGCVTRHELKCFGAQRGGHQQQSKVTPALLQVQEQCEGNVGLEVTLVKLIKYDGIDTAQIRVLSQPASEYTLGNEPQPGVGASLFFETNLISDGIPWKLSQLASHPAGSHSRCEATRLENNYLPEPGIEQRGRHAGCLPRPGLCLQQCDRIYSDGLNDARNQSING
jgi:hypothetical protein